MAAFAFALPILPGQEEVVRRLCEEFSGSEALQEGFSEPRERLGITRVKVWAQRIAMGQALIVYWEAEDPQRTLRKIADSQDRFSEWLRELIGSAAPAIDFTKDQPLPNELLFAWQQH